MTDFSDTGLFSKVLLWVTTGMGALITTIFGFLFKRQLNRIDELEKHSIKRPEYNGTIDSLRQDIKDAREEFRQEHRETRTTIIELLKSQK